MGSSGSGRISDYPASSKGDGKTGQDGGAGGDPPPDRCSRAFSVVLQDAEHSDYYVARGTPPARGQVLRVSQRKRLVAEEPGGEGVGNLPTSHNYLAACLHDGWTYSGTITAVTRGAAGIMITADFAAIAP